MKKTYFTTAIVLAFIAAALYFGRELPVGVFSSGYGPGWYPRLLVVVLAILLAVLVVSESVQHKKNADADDEEEVQVFSFARLKYPLIFVALMVAYAFMLNWIGFIADTVIFLFVGIMVLGSKIWKALAISVGVTMFLYFTFGVLLLVQLPVGRIFQAL